MKDEIEIREVLEKLRSHKLSIHATRIRHPEDTETLIVDNIVSAKIEALEWVLGERERRFFA